MSVSKGDVAFIDDFLMSTMTRTADPRGPSSSAGNHAVGSVVMRLCAVWSTSCWTGVGSHSSAAVRVAGDLYQATGPRSSMASSMFGPHGTPLWSGRLRPRTTVRTRSADGVAFGGGHRCTHPSTSVAASMIAAASCRAASLLNDR
jgi:hypothetical protein